MRDNHSQLVVILDRSGSMSSIKDSTISAYNEFIAQQKNEPGSANVLLCQFDSQYEILYNSELQSVPLLDGQTFVPRGMTALHDAIGHTVDSVGKTLAALPENERPSKVIVAIFTDGGENASRDYRDKVADIIKEQREKYGWDFNFFGANQDAVAVGQTYNIPVANSYTFNQDPNSIHNTMAGATYMVGAARRGVALNSNQVKSIRKMSGYTGQSLSFEDVRQTLDATQ